MSPEYLIVLTNAFGLRPGLYQVASEDQQHTSDPGTVLVVDRGHEALMAVPLQDPYVLPVDDVLIDALPNLLLDSPYPPLWPEHVIVVRPVQSALFDSVLPRGVYRSARKTHPLEREAGLLYVQAPGGMFCLSTWDPAVISVDAVLIDVLRRIVDAVPVPCRPTNDGRSIVDD